MSEHARGLHTRFAVVGVPFCELRELPTEVVGLREAFRMPSRDDGDEVDGRWVETGAAGEDGFAYRHLEACERCSMRKECPGVSEGYLARHGAGRIETLDEGYRTRVGGEGSVFSTGRHRYPVSDPSSLPKAARQLGAVLQRAAAPDWTLRGVTAFCDERQISHKVSARYVGRTVDRELRLDVEPFDPEGRYFESAGDWAITLGGTGDEHFDESEARSREALIERLVRLLKAFSERS